MSKRPASKERPREDREASPESSKRRIEYGAKIKAHVNPKNSSLKILADYVRNFGNVNIATKSVSIAQQEIGK